MNRLRSLRSYLVRGVFLVLLFSTSIALGGSDPWGSVSSGTHSLRQLGNEFFVDLPMKRIEGARLVLFNYEAAKRLGLPVPKDPKELEELVLRNFAYQIQTAAGPVDRHFFATYYQDSDLKEEGGARGDGRAAWTGEKKFLRPDGKTQTVDFSVKGIGVTPLAWTKHKEASHKDGLQSMSEAVYSFIMSEANVRNQLDSTVDLAVIEIPTIKDDDKKGTQQKAAITLRAGANLREAHFKYFQDNPENFRKIFEYSLRRDLGLGSKGPITGTLVNSYLETFARNLGNEEARYYDLHAAHGSPTWGNRTTGGGTIDMGTWRYLDGHHGNYTYLYNRLSLKDQDKQLASYVNQLIGYMKAAKYPIPAHATPANLLKLFKREFEQGLNRNWLNRLGLSEGEIEKVMANEKLAARFFNILKKLHEAEGKKKVTYDRREIIPAAFDMRNLFLSAMKALEKGTSLSSEEWLRAFSNQHEWATLEPHDYDDLKKEFVDTLFELSGFLRPTASSQAKVDPQWIDRAAKINQAPRIDREKFVQTVEKPILERIQNGEGFTTLSADADRAVSSLVDPGLIRRSWINSDPGTGAVVAVSGQPTPATEVPCVGIPDPVVPKGKINHLIETFEKMKVQPVH